MSGACVDGAVPRGTHRRYALAVNAAPLLLLDCALDPAGSWGDFGPWLGHRAVQTLHAPHAEALPGRVGEVGGIVVTGSAASVYGHAPWSAACLDLLRDAMARDIPILGVCYGHQLLGEAVGGRGTVVAMQRPEVGFCEVQMRRGDALFDALPGRFVTYQTHGDMVLPREALETWGTNDACAVQAFRVRGHRAWGVQFHTEYSRETQQRLTEARRAKHPEVGVDVEAIMAEAIDTGSQARSLFGRFLEIVDGA